MKPTIVLVGRPIEVITLGLGDSQQILKDEQNRNWLDIVFDNGEISVDHSSRTANSFVGLRRNFESLGFEVLPSDKPVTYKAILELNQQSKTLAVWDKSDWQAPELAPRCMMVLADAQLGAADLGALEKYLAEHSQTDLIIETDGDLADKLVIDHLKARTKLIISKARYDVDRLLSALDKYTDRAEQVLLIDQSTLYFAANKQSYKLVLADSLDKAEVELIESLATVMINSGKSPQQKLAILAKSLADHQTGKKIPLLEYLGHQLDESQVQTLNPISLIASPTVVGLLTEKSQSVAHSVTKVLADAQAASKIWIDLDFDAAENESLNQLIKHLLEVKLLVDFLAGISLPYGVVESDQVESLVDSGVAVVPLVDQGFEDLIGFKGERVTFGLESLAERINNLVTHNIQFAKWRIKLALEPAAGMPSDAAILSNAHLAARFASRAQQANIVPIVELTIEADGQQLDDRFEYYERALKSLMSEMKLLRVNFGQLLLQTNLGGVTSQTDTKAYLKQMMAIFDHQLPTPFGGVLISDQGLTIDQFTRLREFTTNRRGQKPGLIEVIHQQVTTNQIAIEAYQPDDLDVNQAQIELDLAQFKQNLSQLGLDYSFKKWYNGQNQ